MADFFLQGNRNAIISPCHRAKIQELLIRKDSVKTGSMKLSAARPCHLLLQVSLLLCLCQCRSTSSSSSSGAEGDRDFRTSAADSDEVRRNAMMDKFALPKSMLSYYSGASQVDAKDANVGRDKRTTFQTHIEGERSGNASVATEEHWLGQRYAASKFKQSKDSDKFKLWPFKSKASRESSARSIMERQPAHLGNTVAREGSFIAQEDNQTARESNTWLDRTPSREQGMADWKTSMNKMGTDGQAEAKPPEIINQPSKSEDWNSLDIRGLLGKKRR